MVIKSTGLRLLQATKNSGKTIDVFLITIYLIAIVAANMLIGWFGPGVAIINALVLIGLDLTARDVLHERWQKNLWLKMLVLIASGSLLSWFLNRDVGVIAMASFFAFFGAGFVDTITYWMLGKRTKLLKVNGSNIASALVDSLIFGLWLSFPWFIIVGQIIAKITGGFFWSFILVRMISND